MANELAVVLDKPIEELVPQLIAWNNTELLAEVKARIANYKGRVYDETSIAEAKADRATLNKFSAALDGERKRIKKIYTAPLDKFTAEVNEVIAVVDEASAEIDEQLDAYEEQRKKEKLAEIKAYFEPLLSDDLKEYIPYEKIHKKEWLNATKSTKAVKKEIDGIVETIGLDLATIANLSTDDKDYLRLYYLKTLSLQSTLQENEKRKAEAAQIERLKAEREARERQAEEERQAAQKARQEATEQVSMDGQLQGQISLSEVEAQAAPEQEAAPAPKEYSITFTVTGTGAQLNALSRFLKENHYNYHKI